jgi:hypothetical protein
LKLIGGDAEIDEHLFFDVREEGKQSGTSFILERVETTDGTTKYCVYFEERPFLMSEILGKFSKMWIFGTVRFVLVH